MYYVIRDLSDGRGHVTRRLRLGRAEVVVTRDAMYGKENVYILPESEGSEMINGIEFYRDGRRILVAEAQQY